MGWAACSLIWQGLSLSCIGLRIFGIELLVLVMTLGLGVVHTMQRARRWLAPDKQQASWEMNTGNHNGSIEEEQARE